jgi:hypothetical protein
MPAAIAIPLIMGATTGMQLYGAHKQSQAAKGAAKTQTDAANQAMQMQYQLAQQALGVQQQQADRMYSQYAPLAQFGGQTLGALARGVGLPGDVRTGSGLVAGGAGQGGMAPPAPPLPAPPGMPPAFGLNQRPAWLPGGAQPLSRVFAAGGGR